MKNVALLTDQASLELLATGVLASFSSRRFGGALAELEGDGNVYGDLEGLCPRYGQEL